MARFEEPNENQLQEWAVWLSTRPAAIQKVAKEYGPWTVYRIKSTGDLVRLYSYGEVSDGSVTLTVHIPKEWNPGRIALHNSVFGLKPEDLEECELP